MEYGHRQGNGDVRITQEQHQRRPEIDEEEDNGAIIALPADLDARIQRATENGDMFQDHSPMVKKLGIFSTACLIMNRMIGTGIFETPARIWQGSGSTGAALFMWTLGSLIAFSGLVVYMELGLTIPRYLVNGQWRSVPRSGGEKNYVCTVPWNLCGIQARKF